MEHIHCNTWQEVKTCIADIRNEHGSYNEGGCQGKHDILFRGHASEDWRLETTLDRFDEGNWTLHGYLEAVKSAIPIIEEHYPVSFALKDNDTVGEYSNSEMIGLKPLPLLKALIYLRHHSFPSMFLDWTVSPLIAAHFTTNPASNDGNAAIYVLCVKCFSPKTEKKGEANIHYICRPDVSHPRHFAQQSQYSFCTRYDESEGTQYICSHEEALPTLRDKLQLMFKVVFPRSERIAVLRELYESNINDYTLFQNAEGLAKTLAVQLLRLSCDF